VNLDTGDIHRFSLTATPGPAEKNDYLEFAPTSFDEPSI
jgi:hypothetical protein